MTEDSLIREMLEAAASYTDAKLGESWARGREHEEETLKSSRSQKETSISRFKEALANWMKVQTK